MDFTKTRLLPRRKSLFAKALAACICLAPVAAVHAQNSNAARPFEVKSDTGGDLQTRIYDVQHLRSTQQPVRIIGNVCYSTCTLYLGLPETCISPRTEFGFHGPSSYGKPLEPAVFEHASRLIADHYPEPLRNWYMTTARHKIVGLFKVKGDVLINLGIAAC